MKTDYETPLDLATVTERLDTRIADMRHKCEVVRTAIMAMQKFDGKPRSKRLETAVKQALPKYSVHYQYEYDMYKLFIWGNGIPYEDRINLLLGYLSDNTSGYSHDRMTHHPMRVGHGKYPDGGYQGYAYGYLTMAEEADKLESFRDNQLEAKVHWFNQALIIYQEALATFGAAQHVVFTPLKK